MSWVKDGDIMIYIQSTVRSLYLNLNQSKPFLRHMLALFCRRLGSDIYIYIILYTYIIIHISAYISMSLHIIQIYRLYIDTYYIIYT